MGSAPPTHAPPSAQNPQGKDKGKLAWYQQAELVHCRFAMLGAAGILVPDLLHTIGAGGPAAQVRARDSATGQPLARSGLPATRRVLGAIGRARSRAEVPLPTHVKPTWNPPAWRCMRLPPLNPSRLCLSPRAQLPPTSPAPLPSQPPPQIPWYDHAKYEYYAPVNALFGVQMLLFAWVEIRRLQDIRNPGSVGQDPIFTQYRWVGAHPGGFGPLRERGRQGARAGRAGTRGAGRAALGGLPPSVPAGHPPEEEGVPLVSELDQRPTAASPLGGHQKASL